MSVARRARAVLAIVAALLALGWLSRATWDPSAAEHGLLRLSWRMHGERVETCRTRSAAELEKLPVHMRTEEVCEARLVAYRLVVQIDDARPDTTDVLPGGVRGDRPLFVLREMPLAPGRHRVRVRFAREDHVEDVPLEAASLEDAPLKDAPPPLVLDTVLVATAGRIDLVTLAPYTQRFILRTSQH